MDYNDFNSGVDRKYWYFSGKNDMLGRLIKIYIPRHKSLKLLNIGSGTGDDIPVLNKYGDVFAAEYSVDCIKYCLKVNEFKKITRSDAEMLNFKDNTFDCVVVLDVLEHLKNDMLGMSEIYRVLRSGGIVIISVPAHQILFGAHDRALGHLRRYSKNRLKRLINTSNFSIERITFWNSLMFSFVVFIRLFKNLVRIGTDRPDVRPLQKNINAFLTNILLSENKILEYADSPIGLSLFAVIKKDS